MGTNKGQSESHPASIKLAPLIEIMEELREINPDMSILAAVTLLRAAVEPGITVSKLTQEVDCAQSTTSRNVALLSKWAAYQREGANLLEAEEDPRDRRQRLVNLTPKWTKLVERIIKTLDA